MKIKIFLKTLLVYSSFFSIAKSELHDSGLPGLVGSKGVGGGCSWTKDQGYFGTIRTKEDYPATAGGSELEHDVILQYCVDAGCNSTDLVLDVQCNASLDHGSFDCRCPDYNSFFKNIFEGDEIQLLNKKKLLSDDQLKSNKTLCEDVINSNFNTKDGKLPKPEGLNDVVKALDILTKDSDGQNKNNWQNCLNLRTGRDEVKTEFIKFVINYAFKHYPNFFDIKDPKNAAAMNALKITGYGK